jgi:hypothetical protein
MTKTIPVTIYLQISEQELVKLLQLRYNEREDISDGKITVTATSGNRSGVELEIETECEVEE